MSSEQINDQRFVASSKMRAAIRAEIQKYANDVLASGIAQAVVELVRECESRCTAKLDARCNALEAKLAFLEQRSSAPKATAPVKKRNGSSVAPEPPPAQRTARSHR